MKYFFDNSISHRIPKMLRALEVDAQALREEFPENTGDLDMLAKIKGRDITYFSADMRQLSREDEAVALRTSEVRALFVGRFYGKLGIWDQAVWFLRHWRRIDRFASAVDKGVIAEVRQSGSVLILP